MHHEAYPLHQSADREKTQKDNLMKKVMLKVVISYQKSVSPNTGKRGDHLCVTFQKNNVTFIPDKSYFLLLFGNLQYTCLYKHLHG